jgi:hypothetical protein
MIEQMKHGHTHDGHGTPTFNTWRCMRSRCYYVKDQDYNLYGGRGIKVCDEWREAFLNFLSDMGERPKGMMLDRIDPNGNYERSNCRWVTDKESGNNRRNTPRVEYQGKIMTLMELAPILNVDFTTLHYRLKHCPEKLLTPGKINKKGIPLGPHHRST